MIFVGAGPGAADLITLRGAERLANADVVLFDALTDPALRAHAPHARWIDVGKRGFSDSTQQATINQLLLQFAGAGARVVRLKGGDPSIFGRLEEELLALTAAGIACEVVPGVTAVSAAAAESRRPLTRRGNGRSVRLATAVTAAATTVGRSEPAPSPGPAADTEVYYMAGRQIDALSRRLVCAGWPAETPALVSSRAGWPDALHSEHTLATVATGSHLHAGRPTVLTVGAGAGPLDAPAFRTTAGTTAGEEPRP